MALELEGRIARKMSVQSGTSAKGTWSKQEFVLEYQEGNFPTQICMHVWGDEKVKDLDRYQVGDKVKVSFNLSSREYNGRWYTDVRAWRIEPAGASSAGGYGADYAASAGAYGAPTGPKGTGAQGSQPDYYAASVAASHAPLPTPDELSAPLSDEDLPF